MDEERTRWPDERIEDYVARMTETLARIEGDIRETLDRLERDIRELRGYFIGGLVAIVAAVVVTGIVT